MKEFLIPKGAIAFPLLYIGDAHLLEAADKAENRNHLSDEEIEREVIDRSPIREEREILLHPCTNFKYLGTNSECEFKRLIKLSGNPAGKKASLTLHPYRYIAEINTDKKLSDCLPKNLR